MKLSRHLFSAFLLVPELYVILTHHIALHCYFRTRPYFSFHCSWRAPISGRCPAFFIDPVPIRKIACDFRGFFFPSMNGEAKRPNSKNLDVRHVFKIFLPISDRIKKRGGPIGDRGPRREFFTDLWLDKKTRAPIGDRGPEGFFYRPMVG